MKRRSPKQLAKARRSLASPLAIAACLAACTPVSLAPTTARGPVDPALKRRLVHVDHVDPAKVNQFEDARRQLLAAYAAKGLREGTTLLVETTDDDGHPEFLTLRPFGAYAEIDKLNDAAAARAAGIGDNLDRLDALTHATLVPPHTNEIWLLRIELSYAPDGSPNEGDASAARLMIDDVAPTAAAEYETAAKAVNAVLARTKSPLGRLTFTSSYGTGAYVTMWLARAAGDLEVLSATPPGEVATALEAERAKAVRTTTRVAFLRRELSSK